MRSDMARFHRFIFLSLVSILLCDSAAVAQPFGNMFTHKRIELQRRLPPLIDMTGKTVNVVMAQDIDKSASSELQSSIENLLVGSDSTVRLQRNSPDVLVECAITRYETPKIVSTTEDKTTTRTVTGLLLVSYNISEPRTSQLVASGIASWEVADDAGSVTTGSIFDKALHPGGGGSKASPLQAEKTLVSEVARQIAAYLVKTTESVNVNLAVGKGLDVPNKSAASKLWTRYLEALETMTPFPDARSDTYRIYNISVANEALAYQSSDAKAALKYLREASNGYGKVIDARPDEKGFLEPQNRIKAALAHYAPPPPPPAPTESDRKKAAGIITNADVIEMVKAHMDDVTILDNIQTAKQVEFDLSIDGQVKMSKDGVSGKVIAAMKQKARGTPSHSK